MPIFLNKNCTLCRASTNQDLCAPCRNDLPQLPDAHCPVCLWPVPSAEVCGACLKKPPAFDRTVAATRYTFPIDALIQALKYRADLTLAPILGKLLILKLESLTVKPDLIVPMPLHPVRLRERGFNQAMEIGRFIAKQLNIPLLPDSCKRIRHTPPQAELPWKKRPGNIRKAFDVTVSMTGKHVAVIDDVMTTGATLNELAKMLRQQGAAEISNWVIARALPETTRIDSAAIQ
ncbi:MAG: ComF family protein [Nitrosomonas sp.]|nr:MAG: ComF family protein [Nitrosomonas sp.]